MFPTAMGLIGDSISDLLNEVSGRDDDLLTNVRFKIIRNGVHLLVNKRVDFVFGSDFASEFNRDG
jgi:hypothetical protein